MGRGLGWWPGKGGLVLLVQWCLQEERLCRFLRPLHCPLQRRTGTREGMRSGARVLVPGRSGVSRARPGTSRGQRGRRHRAQRLARVPVASGPGSHRSEMAVASMSWAGLDEAAGQSPGRGLWAFGRTRLRPRGTRRFSRGRPGISLAVGGLRGRPSSPRPRPNPRRPSARLGDGGYNLATPCQGRPAARRQHAIRAREATAATGTAEPGQKGPFA